jgi:hypothetical protein
LLMAEARAGARNEVRQRYRHGQIGAVRRICACSDPSLPTAQPRCPGPSRIAPSVSSLWRTCCQRLTTRRGNVAGSATSVHA